MKRALLIAEKPSVEKDMRNTYEKIKGDLPFEVDFTSAAGHLVGLCEPDEYKEEWGKPWKAEVLPMIPETWQRKVINGKFHTIKKFIDNNSYDFLINACDAGREGTNIFYHIYEQLGLSIPVKRMWYDDQTEEELTRAFKDLRNPEDFTGSRIAGDLREKMDWLVGLNLSRAASLKTGETIQVGRCITAILGMIVNREREIANFHPTDYFEVENTFLKKDGQAYKGTLINPDNKEQKFRFDKRDDLDKIDFSKLSYKVADVQSGQTSTKPKKLHNIADLQMECNKLFKYTSKQVLDAAQSLYEKKILSYPRTDCPYLTDGIADKFEDLIQTISIIPDVKPFTDEILKDKTVFAKIKADKNYVDNKKVGEHPALTPTTKKPDLSALSPIEKNVYLTVVKRFVALFMPPCVYNTVEITTTSTDETYTFLTYGKTLVDLGWKKLYQTKADEKNVPPLTQGEDVTCNEVSILAKQTQPPKHFTEASLLLAMIAAGKTLDDAELKKVLEACEGIGTGATRAELIEKIIRYEWVERKKSSKNVLFIPTDKGYQIVEILKGQSILSPAFTAQWEKQLRQIEQENKDNPSVYNDIVAYVQKTTQEFFDTLPVLNSGRGDVKKIGVCPICGKDIIEGKKSYFCKGYFDKDEQEKPSCSFGVQKTICGVSISVKDVEDLLTNGETSDKTFTFQSGKQKTRLMIGKDKNGQTAVIFKPFSVSEVGTCPVCKKRIIKGKKSYFCEGYRDMLEDGSPSCHFGFQIEICGAKISEKEARKILEEGKSSELIFVNPNSKSKTNNKFSQTLVLVKQEDGSCRVEFSKFEEQKIGQCPICQKDVIEKKFSFDCEGYDRNTEGSCPFSLQKNILGAVFTTNDAKSLCNTGFTAEKQFTWKDGSKGFAKMGIKEKDGAKVIGFVYDSKKKE